MGNTEEYHKNIETYKKYRNDGDIDKFNKIIDNLKIKVCNRGDV